MIAVHDDAIPLELLKPVMAEIASRGFMYGWHSHKGVPYSHWNMIFGNSKVKRLDVEEKLPDCVRALWDHLEANYLTGMTLIRCYVNAHTFGTEGYPHYDSKDPKDMTIVCYMNPEWDINWAGETVLFHKGEIYKAVMPKFRRIFVFPGSALHAGRGVSRMCPAIRTVLVFKARVP